MTPDPFSQAENEQRDRDYFWALFSETLEAAIEALGREKALELWAQAPDDYNSVN